jgi:hypothetical protein
MKNIIGCPSFRGIWEQGGVRGHLALRQGQQLLHPVSPPKGWRTILFFSQLAVPIELFISRAHYILVYLFFFMEIASFGERAYPRHVMELVIHRLLKSGIFKQYNIPWLLLLYMRQR